MHGSWFGVLHRVMDALGKLGENKESIRVTRDKIFCFVYQLPNVCTFVYLRFSHNYYLFSGFIGNAPFVELLHVFPSWWHKNEGHLPCLWFLGFFPGRFIFIWIWGQSEDLFCDIHYFTVNVYFEYQEKVSGLATNLEVFGLVQNYPKCSDVQRLDNYFVFHAVLRPHIVVLLKIQKTIHRTFCLTAEQHQFYSYGTILRKK